MEQVVLMYITKKQQVTTGKLACPCVRGYRTRVAFKVLKRKTAMKNRFKQGT